MGILSFLTKKTTMPTAATALSGRPEPIPTADEHFVSHRPLKGPYPEGMRTAPGMPFSPHSASAPGTKAAGMAKTATSITPSTSLTELYALMPSISAAFGWMG